MSARFVIKQFNIVDGANVRITGVIESGMVSEGEAGVTARGKRFSVVKIERQGRIIPKAYAGDRVSISVKYLIRSDIRLGEVINF